MSPGSYSLAAFCPCPYYFADCITSTAHLCLCPWLCSLVSNATDPHACIEQVWAHILLLSSAYAHTLLLTLLLLLPTRNHAYIFSLPLAHAYTILLTLSLLPSTYNCAHALLLLLPLILTLIQEKFGLAFFWYCCLLPLSLTTVCHCLCSSLLFPLIFLFLTCSYYFGTHSVEQ